MRLGGDLGEDLTLERQGHKRRVGPDVGQQPVVVTSAVPETRSPAIEGNARHDHQIEPVRFDAFVGERSQFLSRFQDPERPRGQFLHLLQQEEAQVVADAIGNDNPLARPEGGREKRARADLAPHVDVAHHRLRGGILGQGGQFRADALADLVLVWLCLAIGLGLSAELALWALHLVGLFPFETATARVAENPNRPGRGRQGVGIHASDLRRHQIRHVSGRLVQLRSNLRNAESCNTRGGFQCIASMYLYCSRSFLPR